MNQPTGPANTGDILYFMRVVLFIGLWSMSHSLSRPTSAANKELAPVLPDTTEPSPAQEKADLPPWQRDASEKAVERYAEAQDKKWRRWNEAMFERSS